MSDTLFTAETFLEAGDGGKEASEQACGCMSMDGSTKTFVFHSELAGSFHGTTEDGTAFDPERLSSEAEQEVSDADWLKLTALLDT